MSRIFIRELIDSVDNPSGLFRTLGEIVPVRNPYGEPVFVAGVGSVVFKILLGGETYALKCYTQPREELAEVYDYVGRLDSPIVNRARFLPGEICICSRTELSYADAVLMPWCGGRTLEFAIRRAAHSHNGARFRELADAFDRLSAVLLGSEWAHGDLKPDNIIVSDSGDMSLVDFDSIYAPCLQSRRAVGTPGYTHPSRSADDYSKAIDNYTIALLSVALHALAHDPDLYDSNHEEGLLFSPVKILSGTDECFLRAVEMFEADKRLSELCKILAWPEPARDINQLFILNTQCTLHQLPSAEKPCSY